MQEDNQVFPALNYCKSSMCNYVYLVLVLYTILIFQIKNIYKIQQEFFAHSGCFPLSILCTLYNMSGDVISDLQSLAFGSNNVKYL